MNFSVIVLAAGRGTRMHSSLPKVLQLLAGKPLLHHVLSTIKILQPKQTLVVCGYKGEQLQHSCTDFTIDWVWQTAQHGTGHAVKVAYPSLQTTDRVVILYGDVPLISAQTLQALLANTPADSVGILTADVDEPYGLGRIIRGPDLHITSIIEECDASIQQRAIHEINTGIYVLPYQHLAAWLGNLTAHNQQQEYYLTDVVAMAVSSKVPVVGHKVNDVLEISGINSQQQLATLERSYQMTIAKQLMAQGVKLYDPARLDVRGSLQVGTDVIVDVNVIFEGQVVLGDGVNIEANVIIKDCVIEAGAVIHAHSILDGAFIGAQAHVGPFARIRPGSYLHSNSKIGNFVEVKNSKIGVASKINHLSYIGDADIGTQVNIGAGVITCNYDGANKHKTIIEDQVFIGSNCELIAPVTIGKGATLAAGTTLTKDAPAGALTLTKKIIASIVDWPRPVKNSTPQIEEK